jgi:large subunit ribosomal protein L23
MTDLNVIIRPVVTEKSSLKNAEGKYVFEVKKSARKTTIKRVFEEMYGVKAVDIKTHIIQHKLRVLGRNRILTKRPVTKRAIISVAKGKTIDQFKIKQK